MHGYGKIILFGEHAVVYGYPALAAGISRGIRCEIQNDHTDSTTLVIPQWNIGVDQTQNSNLAEALRTIVKGLPPVSYGCQLLAHPEIPSRAGLGSSAALAVATIRALLAWQKLDWPAERINQLAFQAETCFHGTPSGIDNTLATFGGFCYLSDSTRFPCPLPAFTQLPLNKLTAQLLPGLTAPVPIVVANTNKERETKALVAKVRLLLQQDGPHYSQIMEQIGQFAVEGYQALQHGEYARFGKLMDRNHEYLQTLGVSCPELDRAANIAHQAGALGAKLTGAGGGGCLIALGNGRQAQIVAALQQARFEAFVVEIG